MKSDFYIDRVDKEYSKNLLYNYHYLKDESKDFKSGYNYGLFRHTDWDCPLNIGGCLAVCIFTGLPVPEIARNLPEVEMAANDNRRWSPEEMYRASMYLMSEEAHPMMFELEVDRPELLPVD